MRKAVQVAIAGWLLAAGSSGSASATVITDPANDFIPSFRGTQSGIDVLSAFATSDGTNFQIGGTMSGTIGTLPTSLYVFGVNRGAGNSNFAAIGLPRTVVLLATGLMGLALSHTRTTM